MLCGSELSYRKTQRGIRDMNDRAYGNRIEHRDDIATAHPDAAPAHRFPKSTFLWGSVDVDVTFERVGVLRLEAP